MIRLNEMIHEDCEFCMGVKRMSFMNVCRYVSMSI